MGVLKQMIDEYKESITILEEILNEIPKAQTCEHSQYPEKMLCDKLNEKIIYRKCEECPNYISKYEIKNLN